MQSAVLKLREVADLARTILETFVLLGRHSGYEV